ncbi:MAG: bacillithiol biosynthesis deacetylase BshB1 [Planctomycetaceae bacterium]
MPSNHLPLDLLVVAPHPDDAEISAGGLLLAAKQQGLRTGVIELTNGEPTPHGSLEIRARETAAATRILQLDFRDNLGLPNRSLEHTLDARRELASVYRRTKPKLLLLPYWEDAHPDHVAACDLAEAARFWAKLSRSDMPGEPYHPPTVLYYWSIHLRIHPSPAVVFDISSVIEEKMAAIRCYESQFLTGKTQQFPTALDDIRDRARYWGWSIQAAYGEPFGSREQIGVRRVSELLRG